MNVTDYIKDGGELTDDEFEFIMDFATQVAIRLADYRPLTRIEFLAALLTAEIMALPASLENDKSVSGLVDWIKLRSTTLRDEVIATNELAERDGRLDG